MREQRLYGKLNKEIQKGILKPVEVIPTGEKEVIAPEKEYDGFSSVTVPAEPNLIPENILEGKSIYGVEGNAKGWYDDPNLLPENIKEDVEIYGVTGTVKELYKDPNLTSENLRTGVTVYEGTVAETTGELQPAEIDVKALIEGTLTELELPSGTTKIKDYAFSNDITIQKVFGNSDYDVGNYTFFVQNNNNSELDIDFNHIRNIGDYAFQTRQLKEDVVIISTNIGQNAFSGNYLQNKKGIKLIPDGVAQIGNSAFYSRPLKEVRGIFSRIGNSSFFGAIGSSDIEGKITSMEVNGSIGTEAFRGCNYISSFNLVKSSNITSLGQGAFQNFGNLRTNGNIFTFDLRNSSFPNVLSYTFQSLKDVNVYLPNTMEGTAWGVTYGIWSYAFHSCTNLQLYLPRMTNLVNLVNSNAFGNNTNLKIYVPTELVDTYKSASNWSNYASSIYGWNP